MLEFFFFFKVWGWKLNRKTRFQSNNACKPLFPDMFLSLVSLTSKLFLFTWNVFSSPGYNWKTSSALTVRITVLHKCACFIFLKYLPNSMIDALPDPLVPWYPYLKQSKTQRRAVIYIKVRHFGGRDAWCVGPVHQRKRLQHPRNTATRWALGRQHISNWWFQPPWKIWKLDWIIIPTNYWGK